LHRNVHYSMSRKSGNLEGHLAGAVALKPFPLGMHLLRTVQLAYGLVL
jgi:hypothetical protein